MTKKVLRLDFERELDFLLVGIVSGHKDYRICFELNSILKIRMSRQRDVELSAGRPGSRTIHSCYHFARGEHESYFLVSNRDLDGTGTFIPEIKNIDYFLVISGSSRNFNLPSIVEQIRSTELVAAAYELQPDELRSAESFLCVLER